MEAQRSSCRRDLSETGENWSKVASCVREKVNKLRVMSPALEDELRRTKNVKKDLLTRSARQLINTALPAIARVEKFSQRTQNEVIPGYLFQLDNRLAGADEKRLLVHAQSVVGRAEDTQKRLEEVVIELRDTLADASLSEGVRNPMKEEVDDCLQELYETNPDIRDSKLCKRVVEDVLGCEVPDPSPRAAPSRWSRIGGWIASVFRTSKKSK